MILNIYALNVHLFILWIKLRCTSWIGLKLWGARYSDNRYSDNRYSDNRCSDNRYSDNRYSDNR